MKTMIALCIVLFALALCGALVVRHHGRPDTKRMVPANVPPASARVPASSIQPMNSLQSGVKLDGRTENRPDVEANRRLLEKLRREEQRQRPQDARN